MLIEHSAVLQAAQKMAERGVDVTYIAPQANGLMTPRRSAGNSREHAPDQRDAGQQRDWRGSAGCGDWEIAAEERLLYIDAVQGAGKIPIDVRAIGCHLLSISGHKMHAPKGVGAMFVRRGTPVESLLVGGSHERRRRAGTENVAGIVGLGKAAEVAMQTLEDGTMERVSRLRDRLEAGFACRAPA